MSPPLVPPPFTSSLIDTVKVKVGVAHDDLAATTLGNEHVRRHGRLFHVTCPKWQSKATVISSSGGESLTIEFSIPKFLTGQNIVGIEDLHRGALEGIKKVLKLMGIRPTASERLAIAGGNYKLLRVDVVAHCDCGSANAAHAMMIGMRNLFVGRAKDGSWYGAETVYVGQHSKRRTLKVYGKGPETLKRPIPLNVYGQPLLTRTASRLVRLEVVLRGQELVDRGLGRPLAWSANTVADIFNMWTSRFNLLEGKVADLGSVVGLSPLLRAKFSAWAYGDALAFDRDVTAKTARANKRLVHTTTGILVDSHQRAEDQALGLQTIQQTFANGFGLGDHAHRWDRLRGGRVTS